MSEPGQNGRNLDPAEIDAAVTALLDLIQTMPDRKVALAGGAALQAYGSPRETGDVDFLANWTLGPQDVFKPHHPLSFGGMSYLSDAGRVVVDLIVRNDAYKPLYDEALENASEMNGVPILTPDYLAALKFAADREKDRVDLAWLLGSAQVDLGHVGEIVQRTMGGVPARDSWNRMARRMLIALRRHKRQA